MPPLPVIPNAVKCALHWTCTGQTAVITFGIQTSLSDLAAVAAAISSRVTTAMWGTVTAQASVNQMSLFRYDGVTPTYVTTVTGSQWVGSGGAAAEFSPASAPVISLRTAARGQWARGRIFLPFTSETQITGGAIIGATVTAMQTAWDAFRTGMASGSVPLAVISLADHPELNPPHTPSARLVISTSVEAALGTQRKRQGRVRG